MLAALKSITPAGKPTVATLKGNTRAELEIRNRKKAEILKQKIGSKTDLNALAAEWGVTVDTAQSVTMSQSFIPSAGNEPRLIGAVFHAGKKGVSIKPIAGNSGVFVVQLLEDIPQLTPPADLTLFRRQAVSTASTNLRMSWFNLWRKYCEIDDYRSRFL